MEGIWMNNSQHSPRVTVFLAIALLLTMSFAATSAASQDSGLSFAQAVVYDSGGSSARSVAIADVNEDGKPDLIVGHEGGVGVLLGNGDGTFKSAVTYGSGGYDLVSVAIADVNEDGKPDIVAANQWSGPPSVDSDGPVGVLLGNGDGTFQAARKYWSGGLDNRSVAIADVNGDGKPDVVVVHRCGNYWDCSGPANVSVLLGNGDGTLQNAVNYPSSGPIAESMAIQDVNGDGKPDLITANGCGGGNPSCSDVSVLSVLLGNGDGTFQSAMAYDSGGQSAESVVVADVNEDGKPDLIVANAYGPGTVSVLLGNGDGTFQKARTYESGGYIPLSLAVADVNGDSKPDIAVASIWCGDYTCNGVVNILLGNGDGTFQKTVTYESGGYRASSVAAGDVNGDGKPDLITANLSSNTPNSSNGTVGVLINTSPWPPAVKASASPTSLWPPNGKLIPVTISGEITDMGGGVNVSTAAYAVIDEYGQVQPSSAIILGSGGKYSTTVWLQASRNGSEKGERKYTITVSAKDNAGNLGSASTVVSVAHDQGR
jgi:hypothetical protein